MQVAARLGEGQLAVERARAHSQTVALYVRSDSRHAARVSELKRAYSISSHTIGRAKVPGIAPSHHRSTGGDGPCPN